MAIRSLLAWSGLFLTVGTVPAQEARILTEKFDPGEIYRVELKVRVSGRLAVPLEKGKPPEVLAVSGSSTLLYDERPLPSDDLRTGKVIRSYRDIEFERKVADKEQKADIRPAVRRMVVLRSEHGKKVPFSPDGPLSWGEIDVVRTDLFCPVLVPGLLPAKAIRPGDKWMATAKAVTDLTDLDPIEAGNLTLEYLSNVVVQGKQFAKLNLSGAVQGSSEDGPSRQKLDGTLYFDLEANRLTYLNLKGTRELFGTDGKTIVGKTDGTFVMTRSPAGRTVDLVDGALRGIDLKPNADNTLLLYDNPDLGVRFLYPRRWRVGAVQGRQVTVEESQGGGILITMAPAGQVPSVDQFLAETREFHRKQQWTTANLEAPRRVADNPRTDRFAFDAEVGKEKVRMEYAVLSSKDGGATVAARLPQTERQELLADVERILRTLAITKRIDK